MHDGMFISKENLSQENAKPCPIVALQCYGSTWHRRSLGMGQTHRNLQNYRLPFINIYFYLLQSYRGTARIYKTDPLRRLQVLRPFYRHREAFGAGEQSSEADRKCFCCPHQSGGETDSGCRWGKGGGKDTPGADDGSAFL